MVLDGDDRETTLRQKIIAWIMGATMFVSMSNPNLRISQDALDIVSMSANCSRRISSDVSLGLTAYIKCWVGVTRHVLAPARW